jgi:Fanconi anemia group M protein
MPDVHPHAIQGAVVSLAAMWRLPVLHTAGPDDSLRIIRFLANQAGEYRQPILRRYARKPKRLASRRIFMLQGLPGVGPALAARLLNQLGSVERVVSADVETLMQIRGVGRKTAARIRELVG